MINIVVCDDDKSYQEIISYKIKKCLIEILELEYSLVCFRSLNELDLHLQENKTDILFLDVMVREENSINWCIDHIKNTYTQIIFMTAFPEEAYNLSETGCCYYLIKSKFTEAQLTKALQRAVNGTTKKDPYLTIIKSGNKNHTINLQNIKYIDTFNNNITLHLMSGENVTVYSTLKAFSKELPPNFLRCHKCYMVNMNHISGYEPYKFTVADDEHISIPPKKYNSVIRTYRNYLLNL